MTSEDYVLKHDFGYGREFESNQINKLDLRNIDDLKIYIMDCIDNAYICNIKDNFVEVQNNGNVTIEIERI